MTWREPPRIRKEDVLHIVRCVAETMQSSNARFLRDYAKTLNGVTPMQAVNEAADALDPDTTTQSRLNLETTIQNMTTTTMNWLNESERQHPEGDPNE
ncbi:hypothetical protein BcFMB_00045 [Bifidobacterium choerinum]|uniref:Uncharacterized protein n=2 Tax=Bifidobacterium choerinum TaxID=35760 RepID=A0A2D3D3E8_9BIFI|nr:hypothetical protein BcFMB_00045 [Bifidobacterium choerinum]